MKKLVPDLFKIKTEEISGSNGRKFYKACFYCMFKFWPAKIYQNQGTDHLQILLPMSRKMFARACL